MRIKKLITRASDADQVHAVARGPVGIRLHGAKFGAARAHQGGAAVR